MKYPTTGLSCQHADSVTDSPSWPADHAQSSAGICFKQHDAITFADPNGSRKPFEGLNIETRGVEILKDLG
ncbi:MAG TPA: hypothetical protein VFU50_04315 [Terriglobales bacterium]|nr:hypothetical protein [Terriglobales bacterium]